MDKITPITDFDLNTTPWMLQMAKAALPFFDMGTQRQLSLMIRFLEFKYTLNYFKYDNGIYQCSYNHSGINIPYLKELISNEDFLNCIGPYCPPMIFSLIKNYKTFASMSDIFKDYNMADGFPFNMQNMPNMSEQNMPNMSDIKNFFTGNNNTDNNGQTSTNTASDPSAMFMANMSKEQQKLYDEYLSQLDNIL